LCFYKTKYEAGIGVEFINENGPGVRLAPKSAQIVVRRNLTANLRRPDSPLWICANEGPKSLIPNSIADEVLSKVIPTSTPAVVALIRHQTKFLTLIARPL
jgi:hypothetical protein